MLDHISIRLLLLSLAIVRVRSAVHKVTVGNGGFNYEPNVTHAAVGDIITFEFFPTNHSVYRAVYTDSPNCPGGYCNPCVPADLYFPDQKNVFFSGLMEGSLSNPPTWNLTINSTEPVFYSCSAPGSCHPNGMVGVINPNSSTSIDKQMAAAVAAQYQLGPGMSFPSESAPTQPASGSSPSPSTASTGASNHNHSNGLSGGAIAGIVVGCVVAVALIGALIFFYARSRTYGKVFGAGKAGGSSAPGDSEASGGVGAWVAGQQAESQQEKDNTGSEMNRQSVPPGAPSSPVQTVSSPRPEDGAQFIGYNRMSGTPEFAAEAPGIDHQISELGAKKSREDVRQPEKQVDSPSGRVELP